MDPDRNLNPLIAVNNSSVDRNTPTSKEEPSISAAWRSLRVQNLVRSRTNVLEVATLERRDNLNARILQKSLELLAKKR